MDDFLHYKRNNAKNTPEYISTLIEKEMNVELLQNRVFRKYVVIYKIARKKKCSEIQEQI